MNASSWWVRRCFQSLIKQATLARLSCLLMRALVIVCAVGATASIAQTWPNRPVRIIVPLAPGGGSDILARLMAQHMGEALGQTFIVENKPGAGTVIGAELAAKSAPDGYTLYATSPNIVINHGLHPKLNYDALRDFAPISQWVSFSNLLVVNPSMPVHTVQELIDYARARPGQINYGSSGNGATTHLGMELLKVMTGIDIVHVPYKGSAPAMADLLSGQVSLMLDAGATSNRQIKAGKLRVLAVTGSARSVLNPEVPTIAESGVPGYDSSVWIGLFAPAGTAPEIIEQLYATISQVLKKSEVRTKLLAQEMEPVGSTPAEFGALVKSELDKWLKVIKAANVKID